MSTKRESLLQRAIRTALLAKFPGSWWVKIHGGPYQAAGLPDLIGCVAGRMFGLEVKLPGKEPTPLQLATLIAMSKAGVRTAFVISAKQAIQFVGEEMDRPDRPYGLRKTP